MQTGLILTIGFSAEPLIFSIKKIQASHVALIGTKVSLDNTMDAVVEESGLSFSRFHRFEVPDTPAALSELCEKFQLANDWLISMGVDEILTDPLAEESG